MNNLSSEKFNVGVIKIQELGYPDESPYHPSNRYPEYPFGNNISSESNHVYDGIRQLFHILDLDAEHWDSIVWNPLRHIIQPGMKVVIKPNFVLSSHNQDKDLFSIITHPSVLRAIVDYCWIALRGKGEIYIADTPQYNCNFQELMDVTRLNKVTNFINGFSGPQLQILDLREYWSKSLHFPSCKINLPGDPNRKVLVNLRDGSALYHHQNSAKLYGAVYHRGETIFHHSGEKQEYELSGTILSADVIISVPKLKVHKKVGVTLNQKGLVGTCTNKNWLVHYTLGSPLEGGDQYPDGLFTGTERTVIKFERWMYDHFLAKQTKRHELVHRFLYGFVYLRIFSHLGLSISPQKRLLDTGNWYGNDSAWRMVVDLAKIINFADSEGQLHTQRRLRLFSIIDGIIGGENNGPLSPDPKSAGILIGGDNLLAVDLVATRLMGFDPWKLKQFSMLDAKFDFGPRKLEEIKIKSNQEVFETDFTGKTNRFLDFRPHPGWAGHIEI
jgi:uncharacterized protein (DUF362 family)